MSEPVGEGLFVCIQFYLQYFQIYDSEAQIPYADNEFTGLAQ